MVIRQLFHVEMYVKYQKHQHIQMDDWTFWSETKSCYLVPICRTIITCPNQLIKNAKSYYFLTGHIDFQLTIIACLN